MTQTQFIMTGKSTKTMNGSNTKTATRTYKMTARTANTCQVTLKVNGRENAQVLVSYSIAAGKLTPTVKVLTAGKTITPADQSEIMALAKKALKIA